MLWPLDSKHQKLFMTHQWKPRLVFIRQNINQWEVTSFGPMRMTEFWKLEKTNLEIAIKEGIYFNLDNVDEVLKVEELLNTSCKGNLSGFSERHCRGCWNTSSALSETDKWSHVKLSLSRVFIFLENSISFQGIDVTGRIGIRVNPVVGGGKVAILSTAGKTSKFGLLMVDECEAKLLELYGKYKFLQGES